jgi:hypothetical protein
VVRPRRVVRFARLIHRPVRILGVPSARATCGGNLSLTGLPRSVMPRSYRSAETRSARIKLRRRERIEENAPWRVQVWSWTYARLRIGAGEVKLNG